MFWQAEDGSQQISTWSQELERVSATRIALYDGAERFFISATSNDFSEFVRTLMGYLTTLPNSRGESGFGDADVSIWSASLGSASLRSASLRSALAAHHCYYATVTEENTSVAAASRPTGALTSDTHEEDTSAAESRLRRLLDEGREQQFEDGMDTPFSLGISDLVRALGTSAMGAIRKHWRLLARMHPDEFCEILIQLGRVDHEATRVARRTLLEEALRHPDAGVRDAAVLGLDALGDPASEPAIREAAHRESVRSIRGTLEAMLQESVGRAS